MQGMQKKSITLAVALVFSHCVVSAEEIQNPSSQPLLAEAGQFNAMIAEYLDEVVVSGTRVEQKLQDLSAVATTISADQIEKQMPVDIKDMLRYETGVSVRSQPNRASAVFRATGRTGNEGINIRGLEGNQVLMQTDGVRLPAIYENGPFGSGRGDYIEPDAYKRVEILRGPASSTYGSDGLAGAVSFITKDPKDLLTLNKDWQVGLRTGYATADKSWVAVPSFAYVNDVFEVMALASFRRGHETDNQGTNNARNINRTTPNPQEYASDYVLAKFVFKPNEHHQIKLTVEDLDREIDTNVLSFFGDPFTVQTLTGVRVGEEISRNLFKVDYAFQDDSNRWVQSAKLSVFKQDSENRQVGSETRSTAPVLRIRDTDYVEDLVGGTLQLESQFGDSIKHRLVYGIDASQTEVSSLRDGFNSSGAAFVRSKNFPDTDFSLLGIFLQDEISLGNVSLIPGIRYDQFELDPTVDAAYLASTTTPAVRLEGSAISPKLGAIWKLDPLFNPFAQYSRGFRAPQPVQVNNGFTMLSGTNPYTTIGNPNLKPETSDTIEVGVRGQNHRLRYSASAFSARYKDFIAGNILIENNPFPTPDIFQSVNLNRVDIQGFELRGDWAFNEDWSASISYAHARGDQISGGVETPLITIDPDKLVLGLRYDKEARYGAQAWLTMVERKQRNPDPGQFYTPGSFEVLDLMAYYNINQHWHMNIGLFNVFDRKYFFWSDVRNLAPNSAQLDAFSQPGRNATISVKYQF